MVVNNCPNKLYFIFTHEFAKQFCVIIFYKKIRLYRLSLFIGCIFLIKTTPILQMSVRCYEILHNYRLFSNILRDLDTNKRFYKSLNGENWMYCQKMKKNGCNDKKWIKSLLEDRAVQTEP